jgi:hypothetical protein
MAKLKQVGVMFLAKLVAIVMASIGLAAGIVYSIGGALYDILTTHTVNGGTALAFLALVGMPIIFGCAGFVVGAIGAPVYNLVARRLGGIE